MQEISIQKQEKMQTCKTNTSSNRKILNLEQQLHQLIKKNQQLSVLIPIGFIYVQLD